MPHAARVNPQSLARSHRITTYARPPDRLRREVAAHTHAHAHPATTKQPSCCFSILPVSRQSQVRLLASTARVRLGLSEHGCLNASQRLKSLQLLRWRILLPPIRHSPEHHELTRWLALHARL